jgi:hypothetical protein
VKQAPRIAAIPPESATLPEIQRLLSASEPFELRQHWLPSPEPGFQPARARAAHGGTSLLVLAELQDTDPFTLSDSPNQKTWELGDVFEIFLQPTGSETYFEFHTTPANTRCQFRFAKPGAPLEPLPDGTFASRVWKSETHWHALAEIPFSVLGLGPGGTLRASFSRYDAFRHGRPPILSSTSPHPVPKFHRPAEWLLIGLKG